MAIEILSDGAVVRTITHVLTASLCDKLDGTLTFDFTALSGSNVAFPPDWKSARFPASTFPTS